MATSAPRGGERIAVIADVHGNSWALDAVMADIDARGIERIVALGDHAYGPLDPMGTADHLMARGVEGVLGNEDRLPVAGFEQRHIDWLSSMPMVYEPAPGALAFHGTTLSDESYFLWRVERGSLRRATAPELREAVRSVAAEPGCGGGTRPVDLVLCAHDHMPYSERAGVVQVVDPGSVGLPAYADDSPVSHSMESCSPHARYAVVERSGQEWVIEHVELEYDWDAAAACATANGREDWASWLMTGCAVRRRGGAGSDRETG